METNNLSTLVYGGILLIAICILLYIFNRIRPRPFFNYE